MLLARRYLRLICLSSEGDNGFVLFEIGVKGTRSLISLPVPIGLHRRNPAPTQITPPPAKMLERVVLLCRRSVRVDERDGLQPKLRARKAGESVVTRPGAEKVDPVLGLPRNQNELR